MTRINRCSCRTSHAQPASARHSRPGMRRMFLPGIRVYGRAQNPEHLGEYIRNSDALQHIYQRIQLLHLSHFEDLSKGSQRLSL
jgi:hypothetical protein